MSGTLGVSLKESITKVTINFVYNTGQYISASLTYTRRQRSSKNHKLCWHNRRIKIDPLIGCWTSFGVCLGGRISDGLGGTNCNAVRDHGGGITDAV
jgi:hypothetical protein